MERGGGEGALSVAKINQNAASKGGEKNREEGRR